MSRPDPLKQAVADPTTTLERIEKARCERSLLHFVKTFWPVLEPGTTMKDGKVLEVMCEHLEAVTDGKITRLLINVPPGHMKSLLCSVFWPAWEWGPKQKGHHRYLSFAYSENLTMRDNRKCLQVLKSDLYQKYWGDVLQLDPEEQAKGKFANKQMGFKLATSVGGVGTGERGDRVIIDDPHSVSGAESEATRTNTLMWFTETLPTRVNDPDNSVMVCIMQRIHQRDVSGLILEDLYDDWDHLCLPLHYDPDHPHPSKTSLGFVDWRTEEGEILWPERFSKEAIERDTKAMSAVGGEYAVSGQFEQRPAPRGGGMFKRDDFPIVKAPPSRVIKWVRGWDLASSKKSRAAYTTGVLMGKMEAGGFVIADVIRRRMSPLEVKTTMRATAEQDGLDVQQSIPQDPGQAGVHQKQDHALNLAGYDVHTSLESGSKEDRARPLAAQAEAGNVYLVQGRWNEEFLREVSVFPAGQFMDQVDGSTRAFAQLLKKKDKGVGGAPQVING